MTVGTEANKVRGERRHRRAGWTGQRGSVVCQALPLRRLRCSPPMRACAAHCCACTACVGRGVEGCGPTTRAALLPCPRCRVCGTPRCALRGVSCACSCTSTRVARLVWSRARAAHRSTRPLPFLPRSARFPAASARCVCSQHSITLWVAFSLRRSVLTRCCDAGGEHCLQRGRQGWLQDQPDGWRRHNSGEGAHNARS